MNVPCLILARGGSVRSPRKNVRPFCGKPLLTWTIEAALQELPSEMVFVSTDDEEIEDIARIAGATIIRRDWISGANEVGNVPALHALQKIDPERRYSRFMCLMPTVPCRLPGDVAKLIDFANRTSYFATVTGYCQKETCILMRVDDVGGVFTIFDKGYRYWTSAMSDMICDRAVYEAMSPRVIEHDDIEPKVYGVSPIKIWQMADCDTEEQREYAEFWFQRKIIDVYGRNPYERKGRA
jgi:molybdopterin-guanine dinucleotide biosynthesis protein A